MIACELIKSLPFVDYGGLLLVVYTPLKSIFLYLNARVVSTLHYYHGSHYLACGYSEYLSPGGMASGKSAMFGEYRR